MAIKNVIRSTIFNIRNRASKQTPVDAAIRELVDQLNADTDKYEAECQALKAPKSHIFGNSASDESYAKEYFTSERRDTIQMRRKVVEQARHDRDIDALRVYVRHLSFKLRHVRTVERSIHSLRDAGYTETAAVFDESMYQRVTKIDNALIVEGIKHETPLSAVRSSSEDQFEMHKEALRLAVMVGGETVSDYLLDDTNRAMTLVAERGITDYLKLIDVVDEFHAEGTSTSLSGGIL